MAQAMAQGTSFETRIARSEALVGTLARASDYAAGQSHSVVTLEHLLLALTEDADAARVLIANSVDLARLRNDVASFLGQQPPTAAPGAHPGHDPDLTKILAYAEAAARQSPRPDVQIDGAIVLAAIVGDGKSMAATFLKAQGLTFQAAIRVIRQSAAAQAPPGASAEAPEAVQPPQPPPPEPTHAAPIPEEPRAGPRAPPAQKPLWEPMGFPSVRPDPPPRPPAPPARKVEPPRPAPPPPAPAPSVEAPRPPPPSPEVAREDARPRDENPAPFGAPPPAPAPQVPAAARPSRDGTDAYIRRQPPAPEPGGPPPLPSPDAGRRAPDLPPPIPPRHPGEANLPPPPPPRGLGASRPPPPRPNLRLPPSASPEPQLTTPWPEAPPERAPLPPVPPYPPPPPARAPQGGADRARGREPAPRQGRGAPRAAVEQGQLVENIPRRMKVGVMETVEIRIAREGVAAAGGLQGSGAPHVHQLLITRAMSVRLQGEPGRFYIEPKSPETQWTGSRADQLASDYAVWRFTVIPQVRGAGELTLIVASRSIGADGVIADTSLPEQRIAIRVSANITRGLKRWIGWITVAVLGGLLGKAGESVWPKLWAMARGFLSI
ncbi:MAG: hypothetical protein ABS54_02215 [Hyphomicrobium sp. SCN 65-11]|nr:MAG: hypothetical protein ABS54_02215 [Hyphomicrobium sp. SCN 65-11]